MGGKYGDEVCMRTGARTRNGRSLPTGEYNQTSPIDNLICSKQQSDMLQATTTAPFMSPISSYLFSEEAVQEQREAFSSTDAECFCEIDRPPEPEQRGQCCAQECIQLASNRLRCSYEMTTALSMSSCSSNLFSDEAV